MNEIYSFTAKLVLCDSQKRNDCIEFYNVSPTWPLQTDGFVVFKFRYNNEDLSKYEKLDEWESNQTELDVEYLIVECWAIECGLPKKVECPEELKEYNEISGKGKIIDLRVKGVDENGNAVYGGWVYQPFGDIEVPIEFSEYE